MGYYVSVDSKKKVLTIDDSITPNSRDQLLIDTYTRVGYTIRFKSEARAQKAKERAEKQLTVKEIEALVEPYADLSEEYYRIKKGKGTGHGVFSAKSWFKDIVLTDKRFEEVRKTNGKVMNLIKEAEEKAEAEKAEKEAK